MRALVSIIVAVASTQALGAESSGPAVAPYSVWQRCLRHVPPQQARKACAVAEAAYLRFLATSPLLDAHDIRRSRNGLRTHAAGAYDPPTTGSIGSSQSAR